MKPLDLKVRFSQGSTTFAPSFHEDKTSNPNFDPNFGNNVEITNDKHFVYKQKSPSNEWHIAHPLKKFPSVTIVDSAGTVVIGEVSYLDESHLVVSFTYGFSGKAYLN